MVVKKRLLNITKQIRCHQRKSKKEEKEAKKDYSRNRYKNMKENANLFLQYKDE